MAHSIGYNHIGRGRYYTNYVALQESIAPCGNFYIIDKEVLDNMDISNQHQYEEQYGQYEDNNIFANDYQNRKVRQIFTDCNPSYKRMFIIPSDHFVFEWNIMDRAANAPTFNLSSNSTLLPNWNTRIIKELQSCIIWYDIDGVPSNIQQLDGIQFYIEVKMADWNASEQLYKDNVIVKTVWASAADITPFLNCGTNTVTDGNGIERGGVFNPYKGGSGVMGFSWKWDGSLEGAADVITSIRVGFINDPIVSGIPTLQNKTISVNQIWLGMGLDTFISPNMDVDYWVEYDGIKTKNSISGKTHSTLNFLGSPLSDAFSPTYLGSRRAEDFAGDPNLENSMYYAMQTNVGRKHWEYSYSSVPAEYLFPMFDTQGWDGNHYVGASGYSTTIPDDYDESLAGHSTEGRHMNWQHRSMSNLTTVLRKTGNGHIPMIYCQDTSNISQTGTNDDYLYWYEGCIYPSMFHVVRFDSYPKYTQVVSGRNGFWDCSYSLIETW